MLLAANPVPFVAAMTPSVSAATPTLSATSPFDTAANDPSGEPASHEESAGLKLVAAPDGNVPAGATCAKGAVVREERIAALAVDITLNRFGDHDPRGRMFAFEDDVTPCATRSSGTRRRARMAANRR